MWGQVIVLVAHFERLHPAVQFHLARQASGIFRRGPSKWIITGTPSRYIEGSSCTVQVNCRFGRLAYAWDVGFVANVQLAHQVNSKRYFKVVPKLLDPKLVAGFNYWEAQKCCSLGHSPLTEAVNKAL